MILLIDQGNSRLKWRFLSRGELSGGGVQTNGGPLPRSWQQGRVVRVLLASVAATTVVDDLMVRLRSLELVVELVGVQARRHGIAVGYAEPERLGVDRWLAMLGARRLGLLPACIVDSGTAVTVDAVDAEGRHHGGMIVPGLHLMREALVSGTGRLPKVEEGPTPLFPDDTATALRSGTVRGLAALVDGLGKQYADAVRREESAHYLLTGGDAGTLKPYLRAPWVHVEDLVFHGLALLAD